MNTAACLILALALLAATSIAAAAALTTVEELSSKSIRARPLSHDNEILTAKGRKAAALLPNNEVIYDDAMKLSGELVPEEHKHFSDSGSTCITHEQCIKRKVMCFKKCPSLSLDDVEKHFPSPKCTVHCKKCIPTC